jgi:hypothetical protein
VRAAQPDLRRSGSCPGRCRATAAGSRVSSSSCSRSTCAKKVPIRQRRSGWAGIVLRLMAQLHPIWVAPAFRPVARRGRDRQGGARRSLRCSREGSSVSGPVRHFGGRRFRRPAAEGSAGRVGGRHGRVLRRKSLRASATLDARQRPGVQAGRSVGSLIIRNATLGCLR